MNKANSSTRLPRILHKKAIAALGLAITTFAGVHATSALADQTNQANDPTITHVVPVPKDPNTPSVAMHTALGYKEDIAALINQIDNDNGTKPDLVANNYLEILAQSGFIYNRSTDAGQLISFRNKFLLATDPTALKSNAEFASLQFGNIPKFRDQIEALLKANPQITYAQFREKAIPLAKAVYAESNNADLRDSYYGIVDLLTHDDLIARYQGNNVRRIQALYSQLNLILYLPTILSSDSNYRQGKDALTGTTFYHADYAPVAQYMLGNLEQWNVNFVQPLGIRKYYNVKSAGAGK